MKKHRNSFLGILFCMLFFSNCAFETLPTPTSIQVPTLGNNVANIFTAPSNVKATHGLKEKITVSWNAVPDATQYCIYWNSKSSGTFTQINETTKTEIDIKVNSGDTYYFKVCAKNYAGKKSEQSKIVMGSSLACPLISSVEADSESTTLYWYMGNVSEQTYLKQVRYEIYCYDSAGKNIIQTGTVSGSETNKTQYTFTNLSSGTNYKFKVEACCIQSQTDKESSDIMDKETIVSLVPKAPLVSASEGSSKDGITLFITLPDPVKVASTENKEVESYDDTPLYFKISRREKVENASTESPWLEEFKSVLYNGSVLNPGTAITDDYKAGTVISWTDETSSETNAISRGIKYEYKVQSYAYFGELCGTEKDKKITSDKSFATATGWASSPVSFSLHDFERVYVEVPKDESNPESELEKVVDYNSI